MYELSLSLASEAISRLGQGDLTFSNKLLETVRIPNPKICKELFSFCY